MNIEKFQEGGKTATLYLSEKENMPLIILNTYSGNGDSVVEELRKLDSRDCNLLVVGDLKWDHDYDALVLSASVSGRYPLYGRSRRNKEIGFSDMQDYMKI